LFAHFNMSQWPPNLTLQCGCVHAGCLLLKHFPFWELYSNNSVASVVSQLRFNWLVSS